MDAAAWLWVVAVVGFVAWWGVPRLRYGLQRAMSRKWPQTSATIQSVTIGWVPAGNAGIPGAFVAYIYCVDGMRCAGIFAMYGGFGRTDSRGDLERMAKVLSGSAVEIRYSLSDICASLLVNARDPRFDGLNVSQDPEYLKHMPQVHIGDLVR